MRDFTEEDKVDLCYAVDDLCNLIEHLFEKQLIPYSMVEWAYNSKCNAQNTVQQVKDNPVQLNNLIDKKNNLKLKIKCR